MVSAHRFDTYDVCHSGLATHDLPDRQVLSQSRCLLEISQGSWDGRAFVRNSERTAQTQVGRNNVDIAHERTRVDGKAGLHKVRGRLAASEDMGVPRI